MELKPPFSFDSSSTQKKGRVRIRHRNTGFCYSDCEYLMVPTLSFIFLSLEMFVCVFCLTGFVCCSGCEAWTTVTGVTSPSSTSALLCSSPRRRKGSLHPYKKDKDSRKGKGRRCCLGGRIYSIPCRTSCFAQVDLNNGMNCTKLARQGI